MGQIGAGGSQLPGHRRRLPAAGHLGPVGVGIATGLLSSCTSLYDRLGYMLQYSSFAIGSGLGDFYAARGFTVLPRGAGINMWVLLGRSVALGTDGTEQLFAR